MASRRALRASAMLMRRYVRPPTRRRPANAVRVRIPGERAATAALSPTPASPARLPLSASRQGSSCQGHRLQPPVSSPAAAGRASGFQLRPAAAPLTPPSPTAPRPPFRS
jgi:hypothetical protein